MWASSTSIIGMLSRIGYTLRHSPHLRLCPSSLSTSGFLHTGHTRISSNSLSIMTQHLTPFAPPVRLSRDNSPAQALARDVPAIHVYTASAKHLLPKNYDNIF